MSHLCLQSCLKFNDFIGTGPVFMWQAMLTADKWHRWIFRLDIRIFCSM